MWILYIKMGNIMSIQAQTLDKEDKKHFGCWPMGNEGTKQCSETFITRFANVRFIGYWLFNKLSEGHNYLKSYCAFYFH